MHFGKWLLVSIELSQLKLTKTALGNMIALAYKGDFSGTDPLSLLRYKVLLGRLNY